MFYSLSSLLNIVQLLKLTILLLPDSFHHLILVYFFNLEFHVCYINSIFKCN